MPFPLAAMSSPTAAGPLPREAVPASPVTRAQLKRLGTYAERTGLEFVCVDPRTGVVLDVSRPGALATLPAAANDTWRV